LRIEATPEGRVRAELDLTADEAVRAGIACQVVGLHHLGHLLYDRGWDASQAAWEHEPAEEPEAGPPVESEGGEL
jgi:hypothetical protein